MILGLFQYGIFEVVSRSAMSSMRRGVSAKANGQDFGAGSVLSL